MTDPNHGGTDGGRTDSGGTDGVDAFPAWETRWQQVAKRLYDPDQDDALTTVIVFAIADAEDVRPTEITTPTLYEVVDVAAIEQVLFGTLPTESPRETTGRLEFRYTEYLVEVNSDGWVQLYEPAESEPR